MGRSVGCRQNEQLRVRLQHCQLPIHFEQADPTDWLRGRGIQCWHKVIIKTEKGNFFIFIMVSVLQITLSILS